MPNDVLSEKQTRSRRFAPLGVVFGLLGILLFAYFVSRAGVGDIAARIQRLGAGFILILAVSSLRYIVRALAWTRCIEPPHQLRFRDAFAARLMGDALGNIVPFLSVAVSEPSKAVFVKDRVPLMVGLSGLAIENIFYALSVALFVFTGTATLLLTFSLPKGLRYASIAALVVTMLIIPLAYLIMRSQTRFLSGVVGYLGDRGVARSFMGKLKPRAESLEERIYGFYANTQRSFLSIFALDMCFHIAGIVEVFITLSFISPVAPTLTQAFILESVNRIINVTFKFIPLRAGVDEGGTGQVSKVLGFARGIGETLAIVRKGRDIFWSAIGVLLIWKKGFSLQRLSE
ncbi:MAG TPA: lysylphosphatidylglycerol synthase transmembrane domain-containing protein [Pyrinomonadaceae bacterium]|nr:lysylphosphatidylglycerol synthase transmembrane domain-containing protein [Pyrinomonadaceae bacterium]